MKLLVKKGRTSLLVKVFIQDSSSTTGAGLTGLTSGSASLVCHRARDDDGNAAGTQLALSGGTRGTWSSGGFVEKDATNMPGLYELGLDNNGLLTGSETVIYMLKGATNMAPLALEIQLVAFDPQAATNLGLSALPTANPGAANGVFIAGTNAATTVTTSFTTTFTGNLTGSAASVTGAVGSVTGAVGSVTGAVASVTGNVGGNVTGSVGSVVGAVGSVTGLTASDVGAIKTTIGVAGAGLTALGDTRIAHIDADVSSRMATFSYTAPDNTSIAAVKVQTDKITFTVTNQVDTNIKSVAGITVHGVGTAGNPWGP